MDINTPIENPNLIRELEFFNKNPSKEKKINILRKMSETKVLSPISIQGNQKLEQGKFELVSNMKVNLINIEDNDKNIYLPVFTDWNQSNKWNKGNTRNMAFTLADYVKILKTNKHMFGIVINPFEHNLVYKTDELVSVFNSFNTIQQNETVKVGLPQKSPEKMIERLKHYLLTKQTINSAYLLFMVREINNEESYILVIDAEHQDEKLYKDISKVALQYLDKGEKLDFISSESAFGSSIIVNQTPFYRKDT